MSARPLMATPELQVLARVTEMQAELRLLRVAVDELNAHMRRDRTGAMLVQAIAAATNGATFTVAELVEHADVDPALRTAILECLGTFNRRRLGRKLARLEGEEFDGFRCERAGKDRTGARWVCSRKPAR